MDRLSVGHRDAAFIGGHVRWGGRSVPLAAATQDGELVAEDTMEYSYLSKHYAQQTFGAYSVEVTVDVAPGEIHIKRMLAVCAACRVLNPKTARSQVIVTMTMDVGAALMEELALDKRHGFFRQ